MPGGRVLMIAHHFPPAGGSGSNRALAFARYLPEYGWTPMVLTPAEAWAANYDHQLLSEVPAGLRVVRTRSLERKPATPSSGGRATLQRANPGVSTLRAHVGHLRRFPDAHIGWLPFALVAAQRERFDVAYSSSGPFTSHLVGLVLKKLTRRPWVAELRDGWYRWNRAIFPDYPGWRNVLERRLERAAFRAADRVVLVTDRMADAFRCQYPELPHQRFSVVSNGFDPRHFEHPSQERRGGPIEKFEVLHAGAAYYGRNLSGFLEAAQRVCTENAAFRQAFRLTQLGTLDAAARSELASHPLARRVRVVDQVDHASAVATMRSADLLLLVANTTLGAEATVPGKLFEYLAAGRPVLAIAAAESSTADVLRATGGGWHAPADDPTAIACAVHEAFSAHRAGRLTVANPAGVARFDRRALTGDLARIFQESV